MAEYLTFVFKCLYLLLPAYFANMMPVFVQKINFLNFPVDFNKKLNNQSVFGKNKTFRGFFFGIFIAVITACAQHFLYSLPFFEVISFFDYRNWFLFGFLMGFGALTGDLAKSFFKRRLGIKPGARFVPFDQLDFIAGALIFVIPVFEVTWNIFLTSLILSFLLHILFKHIGFYLKINDKW